MMKLESLDPRVSRWQVEGSFEQELKKSPLDQLPTYEVFVQMREGKSYEHAGIVHAADPETAFLFAKEQFSRRYTCSGMWVVPSEQVYVTAYTEMEENVYDQVNGAPIPSSDSDESFEIFHLTKRGKQHKHAGRVMARDPEQALVAAKTQFDTGSPVLNIWVIHTKHIRLSEEDDKPIWSTLNEKTHRDVISYKAGNRIQEFKEKQQAHD